MNIDGISPPRPRRSVAAARPVRRLVPQAAAAGNTGQDQFMPPEQVEANDIQLPEPPEPPKQRRSFKEWLKSRTKKQWIIFGIVMLLLAGAGVAAFLVLQTPVPVAKPIVKTKKAPPPPPPPTTEASKLMGIQVGFDVNKRPVNGVMIENSFDARPQSGIDQAGVVFEAVAEGGITRFLALFQDSDPDYIGPVRSVRPYYLHWVLGFDAAIAHAGGSAEALANIKSWGVKDLNHSNAHFYRINSRFAPHNLYTDITKLRAYAAEKGFGTSNYTSFDRKKEEPSKAPTAGNIDFNISSAGFNPHFTYDAATNSYARSQDGAPHMTVNGAGVQAQIKPKVVLALTMAQGKSSIYTTYGTVGSGHAYVFQDGVMVEGTWNKPDKSANFSFTDATGASLKLNPGQTWISIVGSNDRVTFAP